LFRFYLLFLIDCFHCFAAHFSVFISDEPPGKRSPPSVSFLSALGYAQPQPSQSQAEGGDELAALPIRAVQEAEAIHLGATEELCLFEEKDGPAWLDTNGSTMAHVRGLQRASKQCMCTAWPKRGGGEVVMSDDASTTCASSTTAIGNEEKESDSKHESGMRTKKSTKKGCGDSKASSSTTTYPYSSSTSTTKDSSSSTTTATTTALGGAMVDPSPIVASSNPLLSPESLASIELVRPLAKPLPKDYIPQPEEFINPSAAFNFLKVRRVVKFESIKRYAFIYLFRYLFSPFFGLLMLFYRLSFFVFPFFKLLFSLFLIYLERMGASMR
jgi:hypothetical protein